MPALIITGNLLDANTKYIAHQTNCVAKKAAHLALQVFTAFPYADTYTGRTQNDNAGTIKILGDGSSQRYVINMMGQYYPGKPRYPDGKLDGIDSRKLYFYNCLKAIAAIPDLESIAFPFNVGCGAAGGSWDFYHGLLDKFADHVAAKVYLFKLDI